MATESKDEGKREGGRFPSDVAEELKDLITGILGNAELALEELQPWSAGYEELMSIRSAAQRTSELCHGEGPSLGEERPLASTEQGPRTVLLVDDEESVRRVTQCILEAAGFSVCTASNGKAGVELFQAAPERFDVALLDYRMPILDGRAAAAELRSLRPELPVVMMSGYDPSVLDQSDVHFLPKPFNRHILLEAVRRALLGVPRESE